MKKWVLCLALACLVVFVVGVGRTGCHHHVTGALPPEERGGEDEEKGGGTKDVSRRGEDSVEALSESGHRGGIENGQSPTEKPRRGQKIGASEEHTWEQNEWNSETATELGGLAREDPSTREVEEINERVRTFGPVGSGRVVGVEGDVAAENGGTAHSFAVSEEEAERIFAANDAAAAAARELRREAEQEDEEEAAAEFRPPLWIARNLVWSDETQEMEVSFRFGEAGNTNGGDGESGGGIENGILVQRIPPGWEVESSSPAADAFAAGSRKLKWLMSGRTVVGREISLRAIPVTASADPGDWDLAATWFTCRWNGKACLVQPEIGKE